MRLTYARALGSIPGPVSEEELSDYIILTGPNGAGKSNLLQAIAEGAQRIEDLPQPPHYVRLFSISQLMAQAESAQPPIAFRDRHVQLWEQFATYKRDLSRPDTANPSIRRSDEELEFGLRANLTANHLLTERAVDRLIETCGKPLREMNLDDFKANLPMLTGFRDPFQVSVTEVFLSYHVRRNRNQEEQWLREVKGRADVRPHTDDRFVDLFGPPPWELLDEILTMVGLDYTFVPPEGTEDNLLYVAQLSRRDNGILVGVDQLSSGERTLLTIALTIYSNQGSTGITEVPKVLLLDEPDASLHPSMVRSLLNVVGDILVGSLGAKVIMTTHSPTTVALAPDASLYAMTRSATPRLKKTTKDEALSALTVGLPTLSVRVENRRQVFVESEYDQSAYSQLFKIIRNDLGSDFSLEFIASGKGGQGNSVAVGHLVTSLRQAGNDSVWGIVDRDDRAGAPEFVVFNSVRYSIENLVLDPLLLGALLLRERLRSPEDLGLPVGLRHYQLRGEHAQTIVNSVSAMVSLDNPTGKTTTVEYVGGLSAEVPAVWLDIRGHDLEASIVGTFPGLRRFGHDLMGQLLSRVLEDSPSLVPRDLKALFEELLA